MRVEDATTGQPLTTLLVNVFPDGFYAVHGDPSRMPAPVATDVRLVVEAAGYQPSETVVSFTAAALTRVVEPISIGGETVDVRLIPNVPRVQDVQLLPVPVVLKGRVVRAENLSVPIAGASVSVVMPVPVGPAVTDADGYFTLGGGPALPVVEQMTLQVQAAGRETLTTNVRLDFRNPFNQGSFALEPV